MYLFGLLSVLSILVSTTIAWYKTCDTIDCDPGSHCVMTRGYAKCKCDDYCKTDYEPVCASDGTTHENECLFNIYNCRAGFAYKKVSDSACPTAKEPSQCDGKVCLYGSYCVVIDEWPLCICNEICSLISDPICASDGKSYRNECEMIAAGCHKSRIITKVSDGPCPSGIWADGN